MASTQEFGLASYYADSFQGLKTANGELYDKNKMTGAHNSYPFGTMLRVTRLDNNQSVVVRVNDRGPFIKGRIVDISRKAAEQLDLISVGETRVKVEIVGKGEAVANTKVTTKGSSNTVNTSNNAEQSSTSIPKSYNDNSTPKKATTKTQSSSTNKAMASSKKTATSSAATNSAKLVRGNFNKYGLYKIQLLRPEKKGFGVQVASYTSYENAIQRLAILQGKWFDEILINIEPGNNGSTNYKVILGQFDSQAAAENYKKNLKRKHSINGFVVGLSNM